MTFYLSISEFFSTFRSKNYQIYMKQNILLYFNLIKHFAVATAASADHRMALCGPPAPLVKNSSSIYLFFSFLKMCWKRLPIRVPVCIDSVPVGQSVCAVCVIAVQRHTSRDQPLNQQAALSFFLSVKH